MIEKDLEKSLYEVQQMLSRNQVAEADTAIAQLLKAEPQHAEALYVQAVIKRLLKQPVEAMASLDRLHAISPLHSRGYQEKGHLAMANKSLKPAISAFESAVELDSALISSWKALVGLYAMDANNEGLAKASIHYERLKGLPQKLLNVTTLINENRLQKAESLCRQFLIRYPRDVEAMRLLAQIGSELGIFDDAEALLQGALEISPDFHLARFDLVGVLQKRQNFVAAFEQASILRDAVPDEYNYLRLYANICLNVGRHEEALQIYQQVLEVDPENPQILLMCGHAEKTIGRIDRGIEYYRRCHAAKPDYGDAYWSLANLKTYSLTDDELDAARMNEALSSTTSTDRIHLCFAIGKAYEDRESYPLAFEYYDRGNRVKKEELKYSSEIVTREVDTQIGVCDSQLFTSKVGCGYDAADPIFIVGLPRSGSTLLEQILASHSKVDGTFELPNILNFVAKLNGRRMAGEAAKYPDILKHMKDSEFRDFGKSYIDETRIHRSAAPYFTDKMPNNFRHLGMVKLILPNAKIIDARRAPMPCCFSGFKQLFAHGQGFSYGLEEIGQYYLDYVRLMEHWDKVLPGEILRVQYEDLVDDLENEVERILTFCGLELEQECIDFHKTDRLVLTPSSEQVRQPIYRQGVEQWRHFEDFLQPLKSVLSL